MDGQDGRDKDPKAGRMLSILGISDKSIHHNLPDKTQMTPVPRCRIHPMHDADLQPHPPNGQRATIACRPVPLARQTGLSSESYNICSWTLASLRVAANCSFSDICVSKSNTLLSFA